MTPRARRILIPLLVSLGALGIVAIMVLTPNRAATPPIPPAESTDAPDQAANRAAEDENGEAAPPTAGQEPKDDDRQTPAEPPDAVPEQEGAEPSDEEAARSPAEDAAAGETASEAAPPTPPDRLRAVAPEAGVHGHDTPTASLGSLDPDEAEMLLEFSRAGAALEKITLSGIWETAVARRQAEAYYQAIRAGDPPPTPLPDEKLRYVLQEQQTLKNARLPGGIDVPVFAANRITVDGAPVNILDYTRDPETNEKIFVWSETAPGTFQTVIVSDTDEPILRITRRFVPNDNYEIILEQRLENLTGRPLEVQLTQYGPGDLREDRSRYIDRRRFRFGYIDPALDPQRQVVLSSDSTLLLERSKLAKREQTLVWPNEESVENGLELSWFAATNRYFALAVYPALADPIRDEKILTDTVAEILHEESFNNPVKSEEVTNIFTYLRSPVRTIEPGATLALDFSVYAGPLDREILEKKQPYVALNLHQLILYQMSSCCAVCTFQWLAHLLLWFLSTLHDYVVFDWALAIIILVIIVRAALHPLTKRSQISMQRFGKVMGDIKPEIEKLQKKYPDDPKKVQQEQMKLMRERGVNPLHMLGCLPMFLQMPIWVALYAMLYFAFDLRHEPAFYGIFQSVGSWSFLGDLSAPDAVFKLPFEGRLWTINYGTFNILPLLMGLMFFVQQKYMTPPPSPTMSKEQITQQKMMKVMMVVMFPLMLYSAPSGLTLYILTSSTIGILESRYIRRHIKEMDLNPPVKKPKKKKSKPRDAEGRAYAASLQRMEEKRKRKQKGPEKRYKKRR